VLKRLRVQTWAEFSRAVKTGATAGKVAATVVSRMERRTKTGNKMGIMGLSDPTGHFEAVLFSEGLAQYREVLEPGAAVLLQLGAELQGEDVRARVLHAEPLDDAAFPAVALARQAAAAGGTAPAVYNAANEACVAAFRAGSISFTRIVDTVAQIVSEHDAARTAVTTVADVLAVDEWARRRARELNR